MQILTPEVRKGWKRCSQETAVRIDCRSKTLLVTLFHSRYEASCLHQRGFLGLHKTQRLFSCYDTFRQKDSGSALYTRMPSYFTKLNYREGSLVSFSHNVIKAHPCQRWSFKLCIKFWHHELFLCLLVLDFWPK